MILDNLEVKIADYLTRFPKIKYLIKNSYLVISYIILKKKYKVKTNYELRKISGEKKSETFFGYYDLNPINKDGLILYHQSSYPTYKKPKKHHSVTINVYDSQNKKNIFSVISKSFNWQQGTRAQWIDNKHFIFNDFDEKLKKYKSCLVSIDKKKIIDEYDFQVCVAYSNLFFVSLNYQRIYTLSSEYGYCNLSKLNNNEISNLEDDGVFFFDLREKKFKSKISFKDIININYKKYFAKAYHMAIHISISPNGEKLIFIHRYYLNKIRYDRLMLYNIINDELECLCSNQIVSHFYWKNNEEILAYLKYNEFLGYWLIDIKKKKFTKLNINKNKRDGHPTGNNNFFISDTYPDKSSIQKLFMYNYKSLQEDLIGEFFHGFKFKGENRCDLHPRYCNHNKLLFFDSIYDGKRRLYYIKINETKI